MKTLQLLQSGCVVALAVVVSACDQPGRADSERAREEAREAATKAGERLADGWLMTKVQAQYFADADVRARDIAVSAKDGMVTLKGRVPDENAHTQALQIARSTDGVRDVVDQLSVVSDSQATAAPTPPPPPSPSNGAVATKGTTLPDVGARGLTLFEDAQITSAIQSKYFLDDSVKGRHIDVDTSTGVVTLRGEVASEGERAQALTLARGTQDVRRVEDALSVNPQLATAPAAAAVPAIPDDEAITTKIRAQYFLDRDVKANGMEVTASNGIVTLQGVVASQTAKERAVDVARQTEGVVQVIDRLQVQRGAASSTLRRAAPARGK